MNSIAQPGCSAGVRSASKMRAASRHRIGRIRLPPANTEYRIAVWIEEGCTPSPGSSRSSSASTARRSSSKNDGSFMGEGEFAVCFIGCRSRLEFTFAGKGFGDHLSIGLLQQDLYAPLGLLELFLALMRQSHALLKQLHRFVQRKLRALEFSHNFLKPRERALKIGPLLRFWFFRSRLVHAVPCHDGKGILPENSFLRAYFWQCPQKYVERPPCSTRSICQPQRWQSRSLRW